MSFIVGFLLGFGVFSKFFISKKDPFRTAVFPERKVPLSYDDVILLHALLASAAKCELGHINSHVKADEVELLKDILRKLAEAADAKRRAMARVD